MLLLHGILLKSLSGVAGFVRKLAGSEQPFEIGNPEKSAERDCKSMLAASAWLCNAEEDRSTGFREHPYYETSWGLLVPMYEK